MQDQVKIYPEHIFAYLRQRWDIDVKDERMDDFFDQM